MSNRPRKAVAGGQARKECLRLRRRRRRRQQLKIRGIFFQPDALTPHSLTSLSNATQGGPTGSE